ncbi:hypothetical protein SNE40_022064 [Patella caerulea]|uniref:Uncharacterized protein n=1 Tax=Patella caerulea TaxID=87958 RepID=A0AAN8G1H3_PATCE
MFLKDEVGYLYQGDVTQMEQFINRVNITIAPNEDQTGEKIGLTLKNVSVEDFGWKYVCQITLGDGEQLFTEGTTLTEVEVKPNTVTPRTDSRTSTATRPPVDYNTIIVLVIGTFIISHTSHD